MKEKDVCPVCDLGLLEKIVQDETYIVEGQDVILPDVISYCCVNGCGEIFVDNRSMKKTSKKLKDKQNEIVSSKIKRND